MLSIDGVFAFGGFFEYGIVVYVIAVAVLVTTGRFHTASPSDMAFVLLIKKYSYLIPDGGAMNPKELTSFNVRWFTYQRLFESNKAISSEFHIEDILLPETNGKILKFIKENEDLVLFNSI